MLNTSKGITKRLKFVLFLSKLYKNKASIDKTPMYYCSELEHSM